MTTYDLCNQLAASGKLTPEMLDVFCAEDKITSKQYGELMALICPN